MLEERKYPTTHDLKWFEKLEELKSYKKEHGHTQVPVDFRENPSLGKWAASSQRSSYAMLQKNNADLMSAFGAFLDSKFEAQINDKVVPHIAPILALNPFCWINRP